MDDAARKPVSERRYIRAIGQRIRQARLLAGKKQAEVGEQAGCSYQQLQKYESGYNRITAERLYLIALATNQPPAFFFEDLRTNEAIMAEAQEGIRGPMILEFIEGLSKLDTTQRKTVMSVIKGLAKESPG